MKILVVCLGNICRSPLAEGVLRGKFEKYHIKGTIDSAGVINFHSGSPPDERAIRVAHENGVDISKQRARAFKKSDFEQYDLILTMDQDVQMELSRFTDSDKNREKVKLFLEYAESEGSLAVPDPYYGNLEGFRTVFEMIDLASENIATRITKLKT